MANKAGRQFMTTSFRNGCRRAGIGITYDDYSEESGNRDYEGKRPLVRFSTDRINPEDLNGEVIIVQKGRKKDGKEN